MLFLLSSQSATVKIQYENVAPASNKLKLLRKIPMVRQDDVNYPPGF